MTLRFDPEGNEIRTLLEIAPDLPGKHVLEIGGGDGRLTWRYAAQAALVTVLEPDPQKAVRFLENMPRPLKSQVELIPLGLEDYAAVIPAPNSRFDLALLAWSL